jgi:hypothetical protein
MQKTEQISQVQLRHKNERNENAIERKNRIIMGGFRDSAPLSDLAPPPPPHSSSSVRNNHQQQQQQQQQRQQILTSHFMDENNNTYNATPSQRHDDYGSPVRAQYHHQQRHNPPAMMMVPTAANVPQAIYPQQQQQQQQQQFFNPNGQEQPFMVQRQEQNAMNTTTTTTTTTTTVRGRERYCSGGAWVGPAPAWPTPPLQCSLETIDFSEIKGEYKQCAETFRKRYLSLFGGSTAADNNVSFAKKKELEVVSRKIGGLLYLMGRNIAEENGAVSATLGKKLIDLAQAMERMDVGTVNAVLLDIGAKHWEEAVYWYPGLKRIVKN